MELRQTKRELRRPFDPKRKELDIGLGQRIEFHPADNYIMPQFRRHHAELRSTLLRGFARILIQCRAPQSA